MKCRIIGQVTFVQNIEVEGVDETNIRTSEGFAKIEKVLSGVTIKELLEDGFRVLNIKLIKEETKH